MILIHITKENREPKVGEWMYCKNAGGTGRSDSFPSDYMFCPDCRVLSLSVIPKAPEAFDKFAKYLHESEDTSYIESFPISNSEEIFTWLHDQGKLGEEWVEWEGTYSIYKYNSITLLLNKPKEKSLKEETETWVNISYKYDTVGFYTGKTIFQWLKENYEVPKRKEEQ